MRNAQPSRLSPLVGNLANVQRTGTCKQNAGKARVTRYYGYCCCYDDDGGGGDDYYCKIPRQLVPTSD